MIVTEEINLAVVTTESNDFVVTQATILTFCSLEDTQIFIQED